MHTQGSAGDRGALPCAWIGRQDALPGSSLPLRESYDEYMKESIRKWPLWTAIDLVLIIVFALLGRREHEHALNIGGILMTALPFLLAYVVMTLVSRPWLTINKLWPTGVLIWLGTVVLGVATRLLMRDTAVVPFVIVTFVVLGLFLMGRRAVTSLVARKLEKQQA